MSRPDLRWHCHGTLTIALWLHLFAATILYNVCRFLSKTKVSDAPIPEAPHPWPIVLREIAIPLVLLCCVLYGWYHGSRLWYLCGALPLFLVVVVWSMVVASFGSDSGNILGPSLLYVLLTLEVFCSDALLKAGAGP